MKELIKDFESNKVEIVEEQQQKKEIKLIGQQLKRPGLILWEYNEKTGVLLEAKFKKVDLSISTLSLSPEEIKCSHKVIVNENCIYFQSLNRKNASKKLNKIGYKIIN